MAVTFQSPQSLSPSSELHDLLCIHSTEQCACKRMTSQLHSVSSDIIASDQPRQARATRAKEMTSGVSHSFSVPNYLPDLNRPSFVCWHCPLSAPHARVKRGCAPCTPYNYCTRCVGHKNMYCSVATLGPSRPLMYLDP